MDFKTPGLGCVNAYESVDIATITNNRAAACWHHGFKFIP